MREWGRGFRICRRWVREWGEDSGSAGEDLAAAPGTAGTAWAEGWRVHGGSAAPNSNPSLARQHQQGIWAPLWVSVLSRPQGERGVCLWVGIPAPEVSWSLCARITLSRWTHLGGTWQESSWNLPSLGLFIPFWGCCCSTELGGLFALQEIPGKRSFPSVGPGLVQLLQGEAALALSSAWHQDY